MVKKVKKKVLVVEDERALNSAYRMILEHANYEVETAFDGIEALERVVPFRPDVILLDLKMPRMDGIAFLEEYQPKILGSKKPKIIVFSNYDLQEEIDQAFSLGADKYVLKAWAAPKDLLKIVSEAQSL
jgi:CheY-like chemotaxis protein